MPKITIVRPNEWANQSKYIDIYIDGEKTGRIQSNQTVQLDLSAGKHKIELKNIWYGGSIPLPIDLSKNSERIFEIATNQYTLLIMAALIIIASILYYGAISLLSLNPPFLYDLIGLGLVYLSLFIPFYSKYYMKLKEIEPNAYKKTIKKRQKLVMKNAMKCDETDTVNIEKEAYYGKTYNNTSI